MKKEKQKNYRVNFQDFHYSRQDLKLSLKMGLRVAEFFYSSVINLKNFFYKIRVLNEKKVNATVICVGNLTTGGVGKTPIVTYMANKIAKERKVAVVSRGYGSKISNKTPNVIKDFYGIKYLDGSLCGDEPLQIAKKVDKNVVVITCSNRKKAIDLAIIKYGIDTVILDDGFSNRKIKKDKTYLAIDSKMRFGNNHLLPYGPLREPISLKDSITAFVTFVFCCNSSIEKYSPFLPHSARAIAADSPIPAIEEKGSLSFPSSIINRFESDLYISIGKSSIPRASISLII